MKHIRGLIDEAMLLFISASAERDYLEMSEGIDDLIVNLRTKGILKPPESRIDSVQTEHVNQPIPSPFS